MRVVLRTCGGLSLGASHALSCYLCSSFFILAVDACLRFALISVLRLEIHLSLADDWGFRGLGSLFRRAYKEEALENSTSLKTMGRPGRVITRSSIRLD